jgi:hypothetical protein
MAAEMAAVLDYPPSQIVEGLERQLGMSRQELALALDTHPRTVERWRSGDRPQHRVREKLSALESLTRRLSATFTSLDTIRAWLREDNRYLGGIAPVQALQMGRVDRVAAALDALDAGVFV